LEFRTTREKALQQKEKKANMKERKKTRGKMIVETEKFAKPRIEKQREDDLHAVLHNGYATEEEKSSSLLLPGAKTRKRYSLGKSLKEH
jgi:hypothetical protein